MCTTNSRVHEYDHSLAPQTRIRTMFHGLILILLCSVQGCHSFHIPLQMRELPTATSRHVNVGFGLQESSRRPRRRPPTNLLSSDEAQPAEEKSGRVQKKETQILDEGEEHAHDNENDNDDHDLDYVPVSTRTSPARTEMDLFWCGREECQLEGLREKVVGNNNQIQFGHPATGQVAYGWKQESTKGNEVYIPRVLLLIKRNDDELLKVAADAVRELTSMGGINIMLPPAEAAKFKHYYDVDNEAILLFEPKPMPSFGGNHLPSDKFQFNPNETYDGEDSPEAQDRPDLVCTLGGDGLLMHASNLFAGPCPPILCVAGGSLGFLTPFSRCEMVDAIRISLGLGQEKENGHDRAWLEDPSPKLPPPGETFDGSKDLKKNENKRPKFKFGANNQICLSMRMRLECQVINREGVVRARFNVLNEVVIDRGSSPYLAALECFCDDVHLTTVQADGVIFSTPTGSTAYSMAAGGSVVHPAVPAILVTPICPHVLSFRSMVFPDHVILRCYVPEDARADASVAFDGKHRRELHRGDSVQIQMSPYPVPTINRADHSSDWLTSLKRNFNFNTRARQGPL